VQPLARLGSPGPREKGISLHARRLQLARHLRDLDPLELQLRDGRLALLFQKLGAGSVLLGEPDGDLDGLLIGDLLCLLRSAHAISRSLELGRPTLLQAGNHLLQLRKARLGLHKLLAHRVEQPIHVLLGGSAEALFQGLQRVVQRFSQLLEHGLKSNERGPRSPRPSQPHHAWIPPVYTLRRRATAVSTHSAQTSHERDNPDPGP
jgi:hypothetical protein